MQWLENVRYAAEDGMGEFLLTGAITDMMHGQGYGGGVTMEPVTMKFITIMDLRVSYFWTLLLDNFYFVSIFT